MAKPNTFSSVHDSLWCYCRQNVPNFGKGTLSGWILIHCLVGDKSEVFLKVRASWIVSHSSRQNIFNCKILMPALVEAWAPAEENWSGVSILGKALAVARWCFRPGMKEIELAGDSYLDGLFFYNSGVFGCYFQSFSKSQYIWWTFQLLKHHVLRYNNELGNLLL